MVVVERLLLNCNHVYGSGFQVRYGRININIDIGRTNDQYMHTIARIKQENLQTV
jgi:hypothetical protein